MADGVDVATLVGLVTGDGDEGAAVLAGFAAVEAGAGDVGFGGGVEELGKDTDDNGDAGTEATEAA